MKKIIIVFCLLLVLILNGCKKDKVDDTPKDDDPEIVDKKDEENEDETPKEDEDPVVIVDPKIEWLDNDLSLNLNSNYSLKLEKEGEIEYSYSYDKNIIKIENDVITTLSEGITELKLLVDGVEKKSINIVVYDSTIKLSFKGLPTNMKVDESITVTTNNKNVKITINNNEVASFNEKTNTLKALAPGEVIITATYLYDSLVKTSRKITIEYDYLEPTNIIVNSDYDESSDGDKIVIDKYQYVYGKNIFGSIKNAIVSNKVVEVIKTKETSLDISKSDLKIIGNKDIAFNLKISIRVNITKITIEGFKFTGDSKIVLSGGNSDISIINNCFVSTTVNSTAWVATNKYTTGVIELKDYSEKYHDNILIDHNIFDNIGDCGINVNTTHNLVVSNNEFKEFSKDGVRLNNGVIKSGCSWRFIGNSFYNSPYSGLFFRTYAGNGVDFWHFVDIKDNYFSNLGTSNEEFSGAVVFRNYQEGYACVDISYNTFNNCSRFIFLRNNAVEAHQNNFVGYVVGNVFETVPGRYYFNNLNSSDTVSTNPVQSKLLDNLYYDGSGNVITPNSSKFINPKENKSITKEQYDELTHIDYHHIMNVDESYDMTYPFIPTDGSYFEISNNKIKPIKDGITTLKVNNTNFEVRCCKKVEMVVRFINIALGEVGYQETDANGKTGTSGNYTKYGAWYGINPGAWCAMFVSWCANQAGVSTSIIPKYASVQIGMEWYINKGLFEYKEKYTPKAGDIMFMKSNGASHTGIVLYCDGTTLYTVEGNTSDMCACRKYSVTNAKITGYGKPQWPYYSPDGYDFSSGEVSDGSGHSTT